MTTTTSHNAYQVPVTTNAARAGNAVHAIELPEEPIVIVDSRRSWSLFDLRDLWSHRELLYFLAWRDLKVRYKQTLLGVSWVVLQPLLMTLVFTLFLGMLPRVPTEAPYPLVVYSGLLPWMFLSSGLNGASASLIGNAHLITKVYFPRVLLPTANVAARLVDFAISFVIMALLMLVYRFVFHYRLELSPSLALLPFLIALLTLFTLSLGILVSCLNVRYRDIGIALPVFIQLSMFISPVIYPVSLVPQKWQTLYFLNPLAGLIESFRSVLLGGPLPRFGLAVTTVATIILFFGSALVFRRIEKSFADVI